VKGHAYEKEEGGKRLGKRKKKKTTGTESPVNVFEPTKNRHWCPTGGKKGRKKKSINYHTAEIRGETGERGGGPGWGGVSPAVGQKGKGGS